MDWIELISASIAGGVFGTLASLFAPWVVFRVEKRKMALLAKKDMIEKSRILCASMGRGDFRKTHEFQQIKPFLSKETLAELNKPSNVLTIMTDGGSTEVTDIGMNLLREDLARIERSWGLI